MKSLVLPMILAAAAVNAQVSTLTSGQGGLDAVSFDAAGNVYVSQPDLGNVFRITDTGVDTFMSGLSFPLGNVFDAEGNFFVSTQQTLTRRDPSGATTTHAQGFALLAGLAMSPDGVLYGADYTTSRLYSFDDNGTPRVIAERGELNGPAGIALDSQGRLYAGNFNDGKIVRINPDGTQTVVAQPGTQVGYITISNDTIYATLFAQNRVVAVTLDGVISRLAGTGAVGGQDGDPEQATFRTTNGAAPSKDGRFLLISEYGSGGGIRRIELSKQLEINQGVSGAWFSPDTVGSGVLIDIEPASGFFFAAWFTYTADGLPDWLTASGTIEGSIVEATVYSSSGGMFDDPTPVSTVEAGVLTFTLADCLNAQIAYQLDDGRVGEFPITRVIPGSEALCEVLAPSSAGDTQPSH